METEKHPNVAVLLATYNGSRFVGPQIGSLKENKTPFILHWLDDHSSDNTREVVRANAHESGVTLIEWHQQKHQGVPGAFFQLLESVDADIYLFCDQDDIWQAGKIDETVTNLLPDMASPALCFSDPLTFQSDKPGVYCSTLDAIGVDVNKALAESRIFMAVCSFGHTQGFTRPLRDLVIKHKDIARAYSMGHDFWLYVIAVSSGTARMLSNVPTTLYRRHGDNFSEAFLTPKGNRLAWTWRLHQMLRRGVSRQARGFILASPTLPPGAKLDRILTLAKLVAKLDQRQSLRSLALLVRLGALWPIKRWTAPFLAVCLCSDVKSSVQVPG